jgi:hypothetical protein
MSDVHNAAALIALSKIVRTVPAVFQILQKSAQHEGTTSTGADSSDVSLAISYLARNLQAFKKDSTELNLLPK